MAKEITTTSFDIVNCQPFPLGQREEKCLGQVLGPQYQQHWRVCLTSGDGFCLVNSATDFMKKPAYRLRTQELKQHFRTAFQQWKKDDRNATLALALQQDGIPNLINQIQPNINDISYELILLLPYPPFNMNYILIENIRLLPEAFILFLFENQVNQRPFDDVYALFSQWFKERYKNRPRLKPMTKQVIMRNIRAESGSPWKNSLLVNDMDQLIYTKPKLQQNFPGLKPQYRCETQMNTATFNPDLPTLIFYLPGGHFSRLECNNVKIKTEFIQKQYEEKTGQKMLDDVVQRIMVAENERLKIFNNKMANNAQQKVSSPPQNQGGDTPLPQIKIQALPQSNIGTDQYLNHLLIVIDGFLLGILQKQNRKYDIHNKEEAKRLLSIFHNDFRKEQKSFSSSVRNGLKERYDKQIETLAILEAIERLKVKLRIAQEQERKQKIRKQIIKLEQIIPQAYKNDSIPTSGGFTVGSFFSSIFGPATGQQPPQQGGGAKPAGQQPPQQGGGAKPVQRPQGQGQGGGAKPVQRPQGQGQGGGAKPAGQKPPQGGVKPFNKEQFMKKRQQLTLLNKQYQNLFTNLKNRFIDLEKRRNNNQIPPEKYQQQKAILTKEKQQVLRPLRQNMQTVWAQFLKLQVPPQFEQYRSQLLQEQQLKQLRERLAKL